MKEFISGIQDYLQSRVKNLFFINLIIAWAIINYKHTLTLLFKDMSIDEKIKYIDNIHFDLYMSLLLPLSLALTYIYLLPYLNLIVSRIHQKTIGSWIKDHEDSLVNDNYKREIKREKNRKIAQELTLKNEKQEIAITNEKIKNKTTIEANKIKERKEKIIKDTFNIDNRELQIVQYLFNHSNGLLPENNLIDASKQFFNNNVHIAKNVITGLKNKNILIQDAHGRYQLSQHDIDTLVSIEKQELI